VIVAIDHLGGRESTFEDVIEWVEPFSETVGLVAIGRGPPEETPFETMAGDSYRFTPYQKNKLADILTQRASYGLVDDSLTYDAVEPIIEWANGNAHDAIAALFVAADRAERRNQDRIDQAAANAAVETLPEDPVSLDRLCVQPENRQAVLRELVELDPANRESVEMAAEAVTEQLSRELSQGTVKRFIYEAAEEGLLDRVEKSGHAGSGRPPSSIKPAFPVPVFRRLYDMEHGESPDESTESTEKAPS